MSSDVDVKVLDPLDVHVAGAVVQFEGAKQRTLFTASPITTLAVGSIGLTGPCRRPQRRS